MSPEWAAVVVAIVAAIISLVSIIVAVASVVYARRQARAAEKSHSAQFEPLFRVRWLQLQALGKFDIGSGEYVDRPAPDDPYAILEQSSAVAAMQAQVHRENGWSSPQDAGQGWSQRLTAREAARARVAVRYRDRTGKQVVLRVPVPPAEEAERRFRD